MNRETLARAIEITDEIDFCQKEIARSAWALTEIQDIESVCLDIRGLKDSIRLGMSKDDDSWRGLINTRIASLKADLSILEEELAAL